MSHEYVEPPKLESLPTFMRSTQPQVKFHSAFPPLSTARKAKSVMERAGFDVYKPPEGHPRTNRSSPNLKNAGGRNFTAPHMLAVSKNKSDPQVGSALGKRFFSASNDSSSNTLLIDAKLNRIDAHKEVVHPSTPSSMDSSKSSVNLLPGFNTVKPSNATSTTAGTTPVIPKLPMNSSNSDDIPTVKSIDTASNHSNQQILKVTGSKPMKSYGDVSMLPQNVDQLSSATIFNVKTQKPSIQSPVLPQDAYPTPPLRSVPLSSFEDERSVQNTPSSFGDNEDFHDANSDIDEFDSQREQEVEDSLLQLLSMKRELSPSPITENAVDRNMENTSSIDNQLQIPKISIEDYGNARDSMGSSIYHSPDVKRLSTMHTDDFRIYNTSEDQKRLSSGSSSSNLNNGATNADMSTIQEDTEYEETNMANNTTINDSRSSPYVGMIKMNVEIVAPVTYKPGEGPCRACHLEISNTQKSIWSKDHQLSGQWHRKCFSCTVCRSAFSKGQSCYVFNDLPHCSTHFHEANGSLCSVCKNGIEGSCLENEVNELFHKECLVCGYCGDQVGTDYFVYENKIVCEKDAAHLSQILSETNGFDDKVTRRRTRVMYL
ncbi:hypothetical protein CANARDRAFT_187919, partial [[Candida] arabinofermentans NRRL YB-2248]